MSMLPRHLSDDARASMQASATHAARANRPRWMVWLGALAVAGALLYTLAQVYRRASAEASVRARVAEYAEVLEEVDAFKAMQASQDSVGGAALTAVDSRMLDKIKSAGTSMGLTFSREEEGDDVRTSPSKQLKRKRYTFALNNAPSAGVVAWLKQVTVAPTGQPGLQLNSLDMKPSEPTADNRPGWKVDVVFTRWERQP